MALLWCLVLCSVPVLSGGHVNHVHNHTQQQKVERLKERWGAQDIIRDMDHLKEDMASIIELVDTEQLSPNELAFYLLRMHDFDDDGRLDGTEIRVMGQHSMEHYEADMDPALKEMRGEQIVDDVLEADADKDGFLDFGEFQALFQKERQHDEM